jgi:hypothetical protein
MVSFRLRAMVCSRSRTCEIVGTEPIRPVPSRGAFLAPVQGHRTNWDSAEGGCSRTSYIRNHFELDMNLDTYLPQNPELRRSPDLT